MTDIIQLASNPQIVSEAAEQRVLMEWCKLAAGKYPELQWIFHIPNVRANKFQRFNLAKQGVKPGVPDLCLPTAHGGFHALYLEMKTHDGRVRPEQKNYLDFLTRQGYSAHVCRSAEEAIAVLEVYLNMPKTQVVWEKNELANGI